MSVYLDGLPNNWVSCTLGDVVRYGKTTKAEPNEIRNDDWVLELEDIEKDTSKVIEIKFGSDRKPKSTKNCFKKGYVLYGKLRPYLNKVVLADAPGVCTTEIIPIDPTRHLSGSFLFYWLKGRAWLDYATGISHGVGMPRLGTEAGCEGPFVLPPLAEQHRIVAKLDSILPRAEKVRERLEKIHALVKRFRQSVLTAAVTGKLTEGWREKNPRAGDWEEVELKLLTSSISYGSAVKSDKEGLVPVLRMGNIQDGKLDWTDLVYTSNQPEIDKYQLEPGDVLFNRTNSPDLVGKTAVYKGGKKAIFAGYLIRVKCSDLLLPDFLNFVLNSPYGQDWRQSVKTDGVSQSNINGSKLGELTFKLAPILEQREIVRQVDKLFALADKLEAHYHRAMARVEKFPQAILAKAFRGELVPQDPNDEPAEKLLERIRQERAGMVSVGRAKKKPSAKPKRAKAKAMA